MALGRALLLFASIAFAVAVETEHAMKFDKEWHASVWPGLAAWVQEHQGARTKGTPIRTPKTITTNITWMGFDFVHDW
jgi:hypothetical protein